MAPDLLHGNRWFARQPPALQVALAQAGRTASLGPGQWIYGEGDEATGLVMVIDGVLRLEATVGERVVLVGMARAGGSFGQSLRRGGGPRIVTARARTASRIVTVSDAALGRIGADLPMVWQAVSELVYAQLDASVQALAQMLALPPRARIAARLLLFADERVVPLSQSDIAEWCGLSRKAAHAHLAALEAAGAIARGYGSIRLLDGAMLAGIVHAAT